MIKLRIWYVISRIVLKMKFKSSSPRFVYKLKLVTLKLVQEINKATLSISLLVRECIQGFYKWCMFHKFLDENGEGISSYDVPYKPDTMVFLHRAHLDHHLAQLSLHYRQDTQLSAQKVLREPPTVDHMMDIEFPYWTDPIWIFMIILAILL